eukprot:CAMPEP_0114230562 /NCGR_PEP_ID=MMETSP0058-20121206/3542_1 /TAXON_ID=36894 /ORGANISM="Pyramimonas parkeae, CCMP726" /LENGTH=70 /DNA_ID=CAMNT_0001341783 /DNA_START=484 /DNA_END=696 /DNA_ORIENTATION=+
MSSTISADLEMEGMLWRSAVPRREHSGKDWWIGLDCIKDRRKGRCIPTAGSSSPPELGFGWQTPTPLPCS